jgi:hypothetical protein
VFKINVHTIVPIFRKESEKMALAKNNQVKFRIDDHTKMALKRVLENKKITIQSIMETLLMEYIIKNIDSVINE